MNAASTTTNTLEFYYINNIRDYCYDMTQMNGLEIINLKMFISNDMAAKHGSLGAYQHDALYVVAAFTENVANMDEFIGQLNLRLLEWQG